VDKAQHCENMADLESLMLYASVVVLPLNVASQYATSSLARAAAVDGKLFSVQWRSFVSILNCTTLSGNSVMLGISLIGLAKKLGNMKKVEDIPLLELAQFSMSVLFYTHTLIQPKMAGDIILAAQRQRTAAVSKSIKDPNARMMFDKFVDDMYNAKHKSVGLVG